MPYTVEYHPILEPPFSRQLYRGKIHFYLNNFKHCYSESSLILTHLNLLLPLSYILSELKGGFFSFLSDLQRLPFLRNAKPHGSAFLMEVEEFLWKK